MSNKDIYIKVTRGNDFRLSKNRSHYDLENAVAVWASASAKDLDKVEQTQVQCLRRLIGAKAHSSGSAIELSKEQCL